MIGNGLIGPMEWPDHRFPSNKVFSACTKKNLSIEKQNRKEADVAYAHIRTFGQNGNRAMQSRV